jgi:hypothetical protein
MQRSLGRRAMGKLGPASFVPSKEPPDEGQGRTKPPKVGQVGQANHLPYIPLSDLSYLSGVKKVLREETQATTHALSLKRFAPKTPDRPDRSDTPLQRQGLRPSKGRTATPDTLDRSDSSQGHDAMARPSRPPSPNACAYCGKHCEPSKLENWIMPNGRWVHLDCELAQP